MKPYFSLFFLPFLFISVDLAGQLSPINVDEEWEQWSESVKISAGVRKGFMSSVDDARLNPDTFYVWKPEATIERICVLVRTNDGVYDANMIFDVEGLPRGFVKLTWPTEYAKELQAYRRDEISMIATIGEGCNVSGRITVCTFIPTEDVDKLTFFINARGATVFVALSPNGDEFPQRCTPLEGDELSKGVNYRCDVPLEYFEHGREYFLKEYPEGKELDATNIYKLKIKL